MSREVLQQTYTLSEENVNDLLGWLRAGQINRAVIALEHLNPAELAQPVQPDNTAKLYEELRSIIDGGSESFTHKDAVQYLKDNLAPLKWTPEDTAYRPGGLAQPYPEYDRGFSNGWDKCAERQATQPEKPEHPEQMARLGWQYFECPACGSEGAKAFPKPEQEPMVTKGEKGLTLHVGWDDLPAGTKLYTSPPQRQPLTDDEIVNLRNEHRHWYAFARAIEAKLKDKNV